MFFSDLEGTAIGVDGNIFPVQKNKDYYKVPLIGSNYVSNPILDEYKNKESEVKESGVATWTKPNGGYFVSVDVYEGTASEVVALCKEAGVVLTGAGATYPYGKDPKDSNIRVAPSFPPVSELSLAMDVFCICAKLAAAKKILGK